jgi:arylsulfatase A-like enzyme
MTRILCAALAVWLAGPWPAAADARKPNLIIFYADDLGYGECGCYGCKDIPTPHIDSIAKNGVRFTQGYVAATYCSPSRAGLMTGKYPTRFGHEFNEGAEGRAKFGLPLSEKTMADRLKALGYATACVGKWHLGYNPEYRPMKRGFDEFYGTLGNTPYYHPNLVDSRESPDPKKVEDKEFYTTDAYRARALDWLGKQKDKPFFLYFPFNAQHAPLQAPKKYLDRFPAITDEKRQLFAAMMVAMDDAIGAVLAKVKDMGQEDNTIVWFVGDNGGPTRVTTSNNGPLRGFKATTLEGGPRVPFIVSWKGKIPAGKTYDYPVLNLDILPTMLAAAGAPVKKDEKLDGVDLLPYLAGKNTDRPHQTLYWRFSPQWAVRHGDYKLVRSSIDGMTPRLFNLADDVGETKDLTESHPEKVKELTRLYKAWDEEQMAPLWKPDPAKKKKKNKNKD